MEREKSEQVSLLIVATISTVRMVDNVHLSFKEDAAEYNFSPISVQFQREKPHQSSTGRF